MTNKVIVTVSVVLSGDWDPQEGLNKARREPKRSLGPVVRIYLPDIVRDVMADYMLPHEELALNTRLIVLGGMQSYFGIEVMVPATKKRQMRPTHQPFTRMELATLFTVHDRAASLDCEPPGEVVFDLIFADRQRRVRNRLCEVVAGQKITPLS